MNRRFGIRLLLATVALALGAGNVAGEPKGAGKARVAQNSKANKGQARGKDKGQARGKDKGEKQAKGKPDSEKGQPGEKAEDLAMPADKDDARAKFYQGIRNRAKNKAKTREQRAKHMHLAMRRRAMVLMMASQSRTMPPGIKRAMQVHARRIARLERIQELAVEAGDHAAVDRAKQLITKEQARYNSELHEFEMRGHPGKGRKAKEKGK